MEGGKNMNVLIYFLVACAAMAAAVWALNRRVLGRLPTLEQFDRYVEISGPERYGYLSRLFAPGDSRFLESARGGRALLPRLQRERRRLLRLLLDDLRLDFEALLALGSMLSVLPTAKDDGYAALLARQSLRFYAFYGLLHLASFWPAVWPARFDPAPLWQQIKALRHATSTLMRALTPNDLIELRKALEIP